MRVCWIAIAPGSAAPEISSSAYWSASSPAPAPSPIPPVANHAFHSPIVTKPSLSVSIARASS